MTAHELPPAAHARPTSAPTATAALLAASLFAALVVPHDALWIGVAIAWAALTAASVHVATRTATRAGGCAFVLAASIGLAAAASLPPIFRWFAEHPASSAPPPRPCSISVGFLCFLAPFGAAAIGAMLGTLLVALVALAHGGRSAVAADRAAMRANAWLIVVSAGAAGLAYVCASDAAVGAAAAIACAGAALFVRAQRRLRTRRAWLDAVRDGGAAPFLLRQARDADVVARLPRLDDGTCVVALAVETTYREPSAARALAFV